MPQTRLFMTLNGVDARRAFDVLETAFEEDGLPLLTRELDEAADLHEVSVYDSGETDDVERRLADSLRAAGIRAEVEREDLDDVDWVAKSLEDLKPVRAGRFVVHGSHDRDKVGTDEIGIEIEAGLAFGTGHHGTTAGCLEMISVIVEQDRPRHALDLGTGSAVLAIAIARLAGIPVLATDIDPVAVEVARANARLNGVESLVTAVTAAGFDHPAFGERQPFDLVVANILAGPLIELAPDMARRLSADGSLILSGILDRQHDAVLAAYVESGLRHAGTIRHEEWVTIHLKP